MLSGGSGMELGCMGCSLACRGAARGANLVGAVELLRGGAEGTGAALGRERALLCEAEGAEARERGRTRAGGPGGPGNGEDRGVLRRHGDGEVGDGGFAENPLALLLSISFICFSNQKHFSILFRALNLFIKIQENL